ncbi:MurR/RpiR family transcriptional regulator [Alteromonas aestuariivivens]|uniref:MurR/RpiR family transcriptional regulator n=1 Tax=Alteromonas aestuariivivens TaxID=1938339 RepID=A0A3D8MB50_9ALTE|nr:MurR/RpiR family transcriptional regulator [Alteromonas aestuariivivens]RDV27520.1 MurR/RpiR family transcriptional regulator [Alteromonas aestuariivivens]
MVSRKNLLALIEQHYPALPPSSRAIANYLQKNPLAMLSQSVADIAGNTSTSKATVSRFFRQLGFESHQDAKQNYLALRQSGVPLETATAPTDQAKQELANLQLTYHNLDSEALQVITEKLATASRITVIGFRNAYPMALHFRQQLKQIRSTVRLLPQPGQTLGEDLLDMAEDEVIILMGFRRRTRIFSSLVEILKDRYTVLITDPTGQVYNQKVNHLIVCHLGQDSPFDSYAAPMSVISLLCNRVYLQLGDSAFNRSDRITRAYDQLGELEP